MSERQTATHEMLTEGFRSYVDALAAIRSFKSEVVKGCRAVMEEALPILARSLDVSCSKAAIVDDIVPSDIDDFGERYAWIGASLPLVPEKVWFSVGIYLDHTAESTQRVQAYVSFYTARKDTLKTLFGALGELRGQRFILDEEEYGVCAVEPVSEDTLPSYQDALKRALRAWLNTEGGNPLATLAKTIGLRSR